jgi:Glycosyltransferase WbsX
MKKQSLEILAYYFPQYHRDPRNDAFHGEGWTEWDLLRDAKPRFPGHRQPIVPAWGEFDESDPIWAAKEIDLAADHGITGFIYDWYWYDGKPFLETALEQGFLKAENRDRLTFSLMWANHDWLNLFPHAADTPLSLMMPGATARDSFDQMVDYYVAHYLHQPNHQLVDGAPYFSMYELGTFIQGMGGLDAARDALESFRSKVKAAGFPDLHLNAIVWGVTVLPTELKLERPAEVVKFLGFSSTTSYAWVHHFDVNRGEGFTRPYGDAAQANYNVWTRYATEFGVPYYPSVSMGWDPSPRTNQEDPFRVNGYPWTASLADNTPAAFAEALRNATVHAEQHDVSIITVNAWNEWTEGSYLLPDTVHGTAYLEAIREVVASPRTSNEPEAAAPEMLEVAASSAR